MPDNTRPLRHQHVLVTGGRGFLGRAVCTHLMEKGAIPCALGRADGDLTKPDGAPWTRSLTPDDYVCHLAYPGSQGIRTSVVAPFSALLAPVLRMDLHVIEACARVPVAKIVSVGSVCAYPEHTHLPTDESQLWRGYPEGVNAAYGLAKRMQLAALYAARQEYGLCGVHLILANLYGPGDRSAHVIPSLITKVRQAKRDGGPVVVWGERAVTRSFLYVQDAAESVVRVLADYHDPEPLNVVPAEEITMEALVEALCRLLHYTGPIVYDASQPTGHRRRLFDGSRLQAALGWCPSTPFLTGLEATVRWQIDHVSLDALDGGV